MNLADSSTLITGGVSFIAVFAALIAGLAWVAFNIWLIVIAIQFLRWGRRAAERYCLMTQAAADVLRPRQSALSGGAVTPGFERAHGQEGQRSS